MCRKVMCLSIRRIYEYVCLPVGSDNKGINDMLSNTFLFIFDDKQLETESGHLFASIHAGLW